MKKRHIALALALAPMLALTSCDTSTSSTGTGSQSDLTSQSSGENISPVGEGFHVEEGIPDRNGDISEEAFLAFALEVGSAITGEEMPPEAIGEIPESLLPTLSKGGWTDALLEEVEPVLTSDGFLSLVQSIMMVAGGMPMDPTMIPGMVGQAYDVLGELLPLVDEDQFAALLVAGYSSFAVTSGSDPDVQAFGLNYQNKDEVLELAKEDPAALAFFEGVIDRSDYGVDPLTYEGHNEETEELLWIVGRAAHGLLSALLENFDKAELAELVLSILSLTGTLATAPTSEDVLAVLHGAGKILLRCLPDSESITLIFEKVAALPSNSRECFENEVLVSHSWGGDLWTGNSLEALPSLGGDVRILATFLGTMLEHAELSHAEAILALASISTSEDPSAMEGATGAMAELARLYVEALGLMGEDKEAVEPALLSILSLALGQSSYETSSSSIGSHFECEIVRTENELDEDAFRTLLGGIELLAELDMEDPDPELMAEIAAAMEASSSLVTSESKTYCLAYEEDGPVGESFPSPTVSQLTETGEELPLEHVLSGVDVSGPGQGLATISFDGLEYMFRYEVSDIDRKISYLELQYENGYFSSDVSQALAFSPDMGSIQEISYRTTDGDSVAVPVEDLIGFDLSRESGIFILPLSEEGASQPTEYRAVPYMVLEEQA